MGKPVRSRLIEDFLAGIEFGKIIPVMDQPESNARAVLERMAVALQAVLAGAEPRAALGLHGVKRGPKPKPESQQIALMIAIAKARGDDWSTIEALANRLLTGSGRRAVSQERLQQLYAAHEDEAHNLLAMAARLRKGAAEGAFQQISGEAGRLLSIVHDLQRFVADPESVTITRDAT